MCHRLTCQTSWLGALRSQNIGSIVTLAISSTVDVYSPYAAAKVWLSQLYHQTRSWRSLWFLVVERSLDQLKAFFTPTWYIFFITLGSAYLLTPIWVFDSNLSSDHKTSAFESSHAATYKAFFLPRLVTI